MSAGIESQGMPLVARNEAATEIRIRLGENWAFWSGLAFLTLLTLVLGFRACQLNARYYQEFGPFYDSMAYHTKMHAVMSMAAEQGPWQAIRSSCFDNTTVCLPYVIAALIGPFVAPSRAVGIWIQVAEVWILVASMFFYFHRVRRLSVVASLILLMTFYGLASLYHFNGGLPDFRMDLSLLLLFATTVTWYLIAVQTEQRRHFIILGVAAGGAVLFRATAPLYLLFALAPCVVLDSWFVGKKGLTGERSPGSDSTERAVASSRRWRLWGNLLIATLVCIGVSGWFFVINFKYLYYYYVVWNVDAGAKLPYAEAAKHFEFAFRHVGKLVVVTWCFLGAVLFLGGLVRLVLKPSSIRETFDVWRDWDVRLFWIGIAPATMLMLRGAGLNPFVAMPSAWGMWLAMSSLLVGPLRAWKHPLGLGLLALISLYGCAYAIQKGPGSDFMGLPSRMEAFHEVIAKMVEVSLANQKKEASYGAMHVHLLHPTGLENVIMFDTPGAVYEKGRFAVEGVTLLSNHTFSKVSPAEWTAVPGETDEQKLDTLVAQAGAQMDYLLVPEPETAQRLTEQFSHVEINKHAVAIRRKLIESGHWEPMSHPIVGSVGETVVLYRNTTR